MKSLRFALVCWLLFGFSLIANAQDKDKPLSLLFLGDNGHHQPAVRFKQLAPVMRERGIELTYTDQMGDLNAKTLSQYAGLVVFANQDNISPEQAKALLDFVAEGKGFIPLHCASFCFRNSDEVVKLIGGQFQRHGTGTFRTEVALPDHPIMKGYKGFESWDETYVHTKHNEENRTVLEVRVDREGREPYTWTRTHGKGRVFYTAWGHDERTWGHPGFVNLVERGIRWAVGKDPSVVPNFSDQVAMTEIKSDATKFEYIDAEVPFYPAGKNWGTIGESIKKIQKPLPPEKSMTHLSVPVGFSPKLFASEPEIQGKPIAMNWDERGRLWICETTDYPNELQREGEGRDRIRIYTDTNGDGVADKSTTFVEKLSIPTSLAFCRGGIIVHQAPHTLFLRDTNGDDVCDERIVLFTGWGTGDTHAGPSNLQYGLDGWYYGIVGYSAFNGTVAGEQHRFGQGLYRFHVDVDKDNKPFVTKLEFLRSTNNNSWGVGFSEEGLLFGSTANSTPSVFCAIPNRYYERVRGWSAGVLPNIAESNRIYPIVENIRQVDQHGGFTAAAGHALYTARAYPREYWNRTSFVTEPTGHLAATFVLTPDGANFRAKNSWNLIASDDDWVAPIVAEVGPDGHVWVIDWYNIIVQHNPTPVGYKTGKGNAYEIPLRDKKHGRVYRVVYEGEPDKQHKPTPRIDGLDPKNVEGLIAALSSDNFFWRRHAQRLLIERGNRDVAAKLTEQIKQAPTDSNGLSPGALHATATIQALGASADVLPAIEASLKHKSAGVRRMAAMSLPRSNEGARALVQANLLTDSAPQVRLASLLALAEMPATTPGADALAKGLDSDLVADPVLRDGLTAAAANHASLFLAALGQRDKAKAWTPPQLEVVARVAEHVGRTGDVEQVPTLIAGIEKIGGDAATTIIGGLSRGWPKDRKAKLTAAEEQRLVDSLKVLPAGARGQMISLATRWGSSAIEKQAGEVTAALLAVVNDASADTKKRLTAAKDVVEFRSDDAELVGKLLAMIGPQTDPEMAVGLLSAIAGSESNDAAKLVVNKLPSLTPTAKPAALRALLSRGAWANEFVAAAGRGEASLNDLSLDQKQALANHPDRRLAGNARRLLEQGGSLPNADRQKVIDELLPLTKQTGDAALGKEVYKKQCAKCHMHSGEGTKIGPDLTGMAVHPKHELLVHLIDPSRSVEGNYRVYSVALTDGRVMTGLLASESKTTVEIVDSEAKRHVIQREDLEELTVSPKSLMPEGFEKQVMPPDIVNLLEFLTQRGQFTPIPLDKVATVVTTKGMFFDPAGQAERLVFSDWSPKTFDGVPFLLTDPQGDKVANAILLYGPEGTNAPKMPRRVTLPCNSPAKAIHFLSGVSGWGSPIGEKGSVSMIVRLKYEDGKTEDHELKNGEHFADYIRRVDVPKSKFAYDLAGRQIRYLAIFPQRPDTIAEIELVKGPDRTAPVVMAVTIESAKK